MSRNLRVALAACGFLLWVCACAALIYVLWPLGPVREQVPIAPTLFAPPGVAALRFFLP
jgi:hypothetical protein